MLSLLVGGRGDDDEDGPPRRRLPLRALLVLGAAGAATGLAVAVPVLLSRPPAAAPEQLASGWQSVRVCRTEPAGECVERGPSEAERLAALLLPLRRVPDDLVTCLAVGERYAVLLRGEPEVPELTVDTTCGPVLAGGLRYEVGQEARSAVADAWAGR